MLINELIKKADLPVIARGGEGNPDITDICYDSRNARPGSLYVSIAGTRVHGDVFIDDAISRGASAVLSENLHTEDRFIWVQSVGLRSALGKLGMALWDVDPGKMILTAITGTNGKTTVAHLYERLYRERCSKDLVWMFGTVEYHLGDRICPADHTTPEALDIFRFVGESTNRTPEALVMEVSSHSLALDRVGGILFDTAVWTNLTQDHLDFHKDMESYYAAKKLLFTEYLKENGVAVINIDDPWGKRLSGELKKGNIVTFGQSQDAQVRIISNQCDWDGCRIEVVSGSEKSLFSSSLRGFFNVYNMTAMIAGAFGMGFTPYEISSAFESVNTVPGRMDRVDIDAPFAVIVDYAHTPDALVNILQTSRPLTEGKLICVFGCGGDRDRTKRSIMGDVASHYSDEAVVTSDNPRTEKPESIIDEILEGIPLDFPCTVIPDRREAIGMALSIAGPGDCVVIAGKGHEDYQEINGIRHHFNDKEIVMEYFLLQEKNRNDA